MFHEEGLVVGGFIRYFFFHRVKFLWNQQTYSFFRIRGLDSGTDCSEFYSKYSKGLTKSEIEQRLHMYGPNKILVKVKPILLLLVQEILNPFYVFQIFSITVWMVDEYIYYATALLIISGFSISVQLYTIHKQQVTLSKMVESDTFIDVVRDNEVVSIPEQDVIPGDVLSISPSGCIMTCDAVLLAGNCIINESMLTGESVPVTKNPIPNQENLRYDPKIHNKHTLFCGTHIIQTRYLKGQPVKAVVTQTGFITAKGSMVRTILYPAPLQNDLHRDAIKFVLVLVSFAMIGFVYVAVVLSKQLSTGKQIAIRSLDILTIAVPPALPAALTIGMVYAQIRLKKAGIFCISPQKINLCGMLDVLCFDKTGTLTEDGLDILGIHQAENKSFLPLQKNAKEIEMGPFLAAMATCHSLTRIGGVLTGDPLEMKMFELTDWILEEAGNEETSRFDSIVPRIVKPGEGASSKSSENATEIGILQQLPFTSALQRMGVIVRTLDAPNMVLNVKGAPEKVVSLCKPETVPDDFPSILNSYTNDGLRVLGLAWKPLSSDLPWHKAQKMSRDDLECDLEFLGLIIMQNQLKPGTNKAINKLNNANIRIVMMTGDNILTAIHVGHNCCMFEKYHQVKRVIAEPPASNGEENVTYDQVEDRMLKAAGKHSDNVSISIAASPCGYAVDGTSFAIIKDHYPHLLEKLVKSGVIFARMTPEQKTQLVELLQKKNYMVGMCGDGANDCGALKTAHAGIALSEAEASVAAPFTSKIQDISCVPLTMREGRAALTTSFSLFKVMALFSMIQFVSVILLNTIQFNLGDIQFLYIDIILCMNAILLFGRNEASNELSKDPPLTRLMSAPVIISLIIHVIIQAIFQSIAYIVVQYQPWYKLAEASDEDTTIESFENTSVFMVSCFQYLIISVVFAKGKPHRKPIYTNTPYFWLLIVLTTLNLLLLFVPPEPIRTFFQIVYIPDYKFKVYLLLLVIAHFLLAGLVEIILIPSRPMKRLLQCRWRTDDSDKEMLMEAQSVEKISAEFKMGVSG